MKYNIKLEIVTFLMDKIVKFFFFSKFIQFLITIAVCQINSLISVW